MLTRDSHATYCVDRGLHMLIPKMAKLRLLAVRGGSGIENEPSVLSVVASTCWSCPRLSHLQLEGLSGSLPAYPLRTQTHLISLVLANLVDLDDDGFTNMLDSLRPAQLGHLKIYHCPQLTPTTVMTQIDRFARTLDNLSLGKLFASQNANMADFDDLFSRLPNLSDVAFEGLNVTRDTFRRAKRLPERLELDLPWMTPVILAGIICSGGFERPKYIGVHIPLSLFRQWTDAVTTDLRVCQWQPKLAKSC